RNDYVSAFFIFKMIKVHAYPCIFLADLWVLKTDIFRVQVVAILRHGKLRNFSLIKTQKGNFVAVGRPLISPDQRELLLVHPVSTTVDDLVLPAIIRNLDKLSGF